LGLEVPPHLNELVINDGEDFSTLNLRSCWSCQSRSSSRTRLATSSSCPRSFRRHRCSCSTAVLAGLATVACQISSDSAHLSAMAQRSSCRARRPRRVQDDRLSSDRRHPARAKRGCEEGSLGRRDRSTASGSRQLRLRPRTLDFVKVRLELGDALKLDFKVFAVVVDDRGEFGCVFSLSAEVPCDLCELALNDGENFGAPNRRSCRTSGTCLAFRTSFAFRTCFASRTGSACLVTAHIHRAVDGPRTATTALGRHWLCRSPLALSF